MLVEQANPLAQAKGFVGAQPRQEIYFVIPSIFSWKSITFFSTS